MSDESKYKNPGHELTDAKVSAVGWTAIAFAALLLVSFVLVVGLLKVFDTFRTPETASALERPVQVPVGPRLQVKPDADMETFKAAEDSLVNNYGWVQKEAGIVRLPVNRAMALMLERGFPVRANHEKFENGERNK